MDRIHVKRQLGQTADIIDHRIFMFVRSDSHVHMHLVVNVLLLYIYCRLDIEKELYAHYI